MPGPLTCYQKYTPLSRGRESVVLCHLLVTFLSRHISFHFFTIVTRFFYCYLNILRRFRFSLAVFYIFNALQLISDFSITRDRSSSLHNGFQPPTPRPAFLPRHRSTELQIPGQREMVRGQKLCIISAVTRSHTPDPPAAALPGIRVGPCEPPDQTIGWSLLIYPIALSHEVQRLSYCLAAAVLLDLLINRHTS